MRHQNKEVLMILRNLPGTFLTVALLASPLLAQSTTPASTAIPSVSPAPAAHKRVKLGPSEPLAPVTPANESNTPQTSVPTFIRYQAQPDRPADTRIVRGQD